MKARVTELVCEQVASGIDVLNVILVVYGDTNLADAPQAA
jgi:hypothetical protein